MNLMPFDELNVLEASLPQHFENGKIRSRKDCEDIIDEMLDLFLLAYANGVVATQEDIGTDETPTAEDADATINKEIAGKTWRQRVWEYYGESEKVPNPVAKIATTAADTGATATEAAFTEEEAQAAARKTISELMRIAETEAHRDSNEAAYVTATKAGAQTKTWHCMMLPTSRDTHIYLNGTTAPIDGEFYSYMGGSTQFPGQWGIAEEDVNCLCWLTYSK